MRESWKIMKLGEVCKTGAGGTPLKAHKDYYEGGTIPWLLSGEVSQGDIYEAKKFITEKGLKNSSAKLFPPNTVLVAMYGATAGQVGVLRFEACTNQAVCGILPNGITIPEYIFYCFLSKKDELVSQAVGGAQPNISQIKIKNTKIPLPPLPEQKRIVSILDKTFAAIEKAKQNAQQNLKNAQELFESTKKDVLESLIGVAEKYSLPSICDKIFAGGDVPKDNFSKTKTDTYNVPIIANAVKDNGLYGFTDKIRVFKPAITIAARGSGTGHTEIRNKPFYPIVRLLVLIPNIKLICLEFLKYSIQNLEILRSGSAIPQLTVPMIKGYSIPLPSLEEQKQIVQKLDTLSAETKKLEAIYQKKIVDLDELKKSVLQKAFNGEL